MGCGSGVTCWRRLREWQQAGVWQRLHELLLAKLREAELIDWSRAAIDSSHVRAFRGAKEPARICLSPKKSALPLESGHDLGRARRRHHRTLPGRGAWKDVRDALPHTVGWKDL